MEHQPLPANASCPGIFLSHCCFAGSDEYLSPDYGTESEFRSQQTALANQLVLITNTLTTADELTPETVEQAIGQLEELEVRRVLVTDGAGRFSTIPGALRPGEICPHWRGGLQPSGQRRLSSEYQDGAFSSRAASPVMNRNQVVGAVCLYDQDSDQGHCWRSCSGTCG